VTEEDKKCNEKKKRKTLSKSETISFAVKVIPDEITTRKRIE
jgi:hypothetical protein